MHMLDVSSVNCYRRQKLTYHFPLLMDHHPQVFEDVIDICDVSLSQSTQRQLVHGKDITTQIHKYQTTDSSLYLQLPDAQLSLLDQPQVFLSDGLHLSLRLGVTAGTNAGEIIMTEIILMNKKWTNLEKGGTPKLSSGCPPC